MSLYTGTAGVCGIIGAVVYLIWLGIRLTDGALARAAWRRAQRRHRRTSIAHELRALGVEQRFEDAVRDDLALLDALAADPADVAAADEWVRTGEWPTLVAGTAQPPHELITDLDGDAS